MEDIFELYIFLLVNKLIHNKIDNMYFHVFNKCISKPLELNKLEINVFNLTSNYYYYYFF